MKAAFVSKSTNQNVSVDFSKYDLPLLCAGRAYHKTTGVIPPSDMVLLCDEEAFMALDSGALKIAGLVPVVKQEKKDAI